MPEPYLYPNPHPHPHPTPPQVFVPTLAHLCNMQLIFSAQLILFYLTSKLLHLTRGFLDNRAKSQITGAYRQTKLEKTILAKYNIIFEFEVDNYSSTRVEI